MQEKIQGSQTNIALTELLNKEASVVGTPTNGDVFSYNQTNNEWEFESRGVTITTDYSFVGKGNASATAVSSFLEPNVFLNGSNIYTPVSAIFTMDGKYKGATVNIQASSSSVGEFEIQLLTVNNSRIGTNTMTTNNRGRQITSIGGFTQMHAVVQQLTSNTVFSFRAVIRATIGDPVTVPFEIDIMGLN